jgi:hypothetical protein
MTAKRPTKKNENVDFSTSMTSTADGGHRWVVRWRGHTIVTSTSGASVSTIHEIGKTFDSALRSLAKK